MKVYVLSESCYDNSSQDYEWAWSDWYVVGVTTSLEVALKWDDGKKEIFTRLVPLVVADEEGREYLVEGLDEGEWHCGRPIKYARSWKEFELDEPIDTSRNSGPYEGGIRLR